MWQNFIIWGVVVGCGILFARKILIAHQTESDFPKNLFRNIESLFENPKSSLGEAKGSYVLNGMYKSHEIEIKAITDTLATRKLPSLWLLTTIKSPLPLISTFDMMLRPAAVTSFSNFDFLPHTIKTPTGFPFATVLRCNSETLPFDLNCLRPHMEFFEHREAKELLITPNGLRIVVQLAEAQRANYAVYREAKFYEVTITELSMLKILDVLLALHAHLLKNVKNV